MNQGMPYVWESVESLREMISKEPGGRKSKRLQLLYLLANRHATTRNGAAQLLGVNRETVGQWLRQYERGGLDRMLAMKQPPGLRSSLPEEVIAAMRGKLQDPLGVASFKALQEWVTQSFGLHPSYRVIHYTAAQLLGARLAVGRRSHVKKKRERRRLFRRVLRRASDMRSRQAAQSIGKLRYLRMSPRIALACRSRCGRRTKAGSDCSRPGVGGSPYVGSNRWLCASTTSIIPIFMEPSRR